MSNGQRVTEQTPLDFDVLLPAADRHDETGDLRCSCGYLLRGLTKKRCPECGRPFPGKPRRKTPCLLGGFLIGFSSAAILTITSAPFVYCNEARADDVMGFPLTSEDIAVIVTGLFIILGLAIAVGTGLIGMLIGYVMYRKKREMKPMAVVVIIILVAVSTSIAWLGYWSFH